MRDGGKEWVTSRQDKGPCCGKSRGNMQNVLSPFPFFAPPVDGPVDLGSPVPGPQTFSLLLGEEVAAVADDAAVQVFSIDPAMAVTAPMPLQFWQAAHSTSDVDAALVDKVLPDLTGPAPEAALPEVSDKRIAEVDIASPEGSAANLAEMVAIQRSGPPSTGFGDLGHDPSAPGIAKKAPEPTFETVSPAAEAALPTMAKIAGPVTPEPRQESTGHAVPFGSAASPNPANQAAKPADTDPLPGLEHAKAQKVGPPNHTQDAVPPDRPLPRGGPETALATVDEGIEKYLAGPDLPGVKASEPQPATGHGDPKPEPLVDLDDSRPKPDSGAPAPAYTSGPAGKSATKSSAVDAQDLAVVASTDPDNPVAQPVPTAGIWERIIVSLAETAGLSWPNPAADGAVPNLLPIPEGSEGPGDHILTPVIDAGRTGVSILAPDAKMALTPDTSPKPLSPSIAAPAPLVAAVDAAFDPFDLSGEESAFVTGTGPVPSQTGPAGSAASAVAMPVAQVAAQVSAALGRTSDGATEFALSPDELGHVRLRLEPDAANPDRMVVMISFERPETLDLFRRHAGELAEAIRAAGYSGADIGFEQREGNGTPDRRDETRTPGFTALSDQPSPPPSAPRHLAGASLDLRL
jgi:Flagellar hook-length control protein FliK